MTGVFAIFSLAHTAVELARDGVAVVTEEAQQEYSENHGPHNDGI